MEILIILVLILLNGFFALSEIALVSSKKVKLEHMLREDKKGKKGIKIALDLHQNSENFLSAIQVGITLISIVTGLYGGTSIAKSITPFFEQFEAIRVYANEIAVVLSVLLVTYVSIVLGELVPKTAALSNPEKIAKIVAPIIYYFSKVLFPFVRLLSVSTSVVNKALGIKKASDVMTESELRQMIKTASSEGVIEEEQNIFHENIFNLSDKKAQHLMTYRTEIEWIDIDDPIEENVKKLQLLQHSKIVCSRGQIDNFVGVLNLKDYYKNQIIGSDFSIESLMKTAITVPEKASAQYVLEQLRANENNLCFVVNEFGGLEGVITLYDIMENIVGYIPEEGEISDPDVFVREDGSILVSGEAPVEVLGNIFDNFSVDFEKLDYSTVAGFILTIFTDIPSVGQSAQYKNYNIEIVDMDGRRIDKILIDKNPE